MTCIPQAMQKLSRKVTFFSFFSPLSDLHLTSIPPAESQSANKPFPGLPDIQLTLFSLHVAINGWNTADNNDFQEFPPFLPSQLPHQRTSGTKRQTWLCSIKGMFQRCLKWDAGYLGIWLQGEGYHKFWKLITLTSFSTKSFVVFLVFFLNSMKKGYYVKYKMTCPFSVPLYWFLETAEERERKCTGMPFQPVWNLLQRNTLHSSLGFLALFSRKEQFLFLTYHGFLLFYLMVNKWLEEESIT